jgi:hypothetical protein
MAETAMPQKPNAFAHKSWQKSGPYRLRLVCAALCIVLGTAQTVLAQLAPHVDFAVSRGVSYLYTRQRDDGSFRSEGAYADEAGVTALSLLALKAAGESGFNERIRKGYDWLTKQNITGTYSLSLRAAALSQLADASKNPQLRKDVQRLIAMQIDRGPHRGLYTYSAPRGEFSFGDLSNSQYGVLGVWYAAEAGIEVPRGYWQRVEDAWSLAQNPDGGFPYRPGMTGGAGGRGSGSYGSMTAAGIATLSITNDFLHASLAGTAAGRIQARNSKSATGTQRALDWLNLNILVDRNPGLDVSLSRVADLEDRRFPPLNAFSDGSYVHYMLFGYERVAEATGLTRFAGRRWFDEGARYLIASQDGSGAWNNGSLGPTIDTAYAVLFLSRGRSPVVVQKLQFDTAGAKPAIGAGDSGSPEAEAGGTAGGAAGVAGGAGGAVGGWNNRTRDAASMVRWLRTQTERHVNWQLVRLDSPPADLRESPILYAASDRAAQFPEQDWPALKRYLDDGGILLAADEAQTPGDSGGPFTKSIETLLARLYPTYTLRDLPKDHPFITGNFDASALDVRVRALSNGVRELAVLLPSGDLPWRWQRTLGSVGGKSPDFSLVGNILVSTTGRASLRNRGVFPIEDYDAAAPAPHRKVAIARIVFAGNWDPEPAGWHNLTARLHNRALTEITTTPLALTDRTLTPTDFPLAHLTSTHPFSLTEPQRLALADYLHHGGFLLYDTAGGADTVVESAFEDTLHLALPGCDIRDLPTDHPLYASCLNSQGLATYRPSTVDRVGARQAFPRIRGVFWNKRLVAVLSPDDLSASIASLPQDSILGCTPAFALQFVSNVVNAAATGR